MQNRILSVSFLDMLTVEVIDILLLFWLLCWSKYSVSDDDVRYDDKGFRDLYSWHRTLLICLWISLVSDTHHVVNGKLRTSPSRPKLKQRSRPKNLFKPMFGDKGYCWEDASTSRLQTTRRRPVWARGNISRTHSFPHLLLHLLRFTFYIS